MRKLKLPGKLEINSALSAFSKREWLFFSGLVIVLVFSTLAILENINQTLMVSVPMHGGDISEGIVGTPRFINPVLAFSDIDQDLTTLIYSGLMRKSSDGTLIPDLAEKYIMSPDGLTYTFTLKDNLFFQDGKKLTALDVVFTINKVKDSIIKSPHKANWDGVTVTKIDDKTIEFTLKQPFASFLDNTTLGIMPEHLWDGSPMELNDANINPIGSGPYMVKKVSKESSGIIDSYELAPFKKFVLGEPYIQNLTLHFYSNEDDLIKALENKTVDQISSITPLNAEILKEENYDVESSVLPRVFGLFFNQNVNQIFTDKAVISAINQAIDKDKIVHEVLLGYGQTINSPIPPHLLNYPTVSNANTNTTPNHDQIIQTVQASLAKDGWTKGADGFLQKTSKDKKKSTTTELQFSISTGNVPDLAQTAELIKEDLQAVGIKVDVKTFDIGNLNQDVIRPRKYDALLFGEIINQNSDLFAFWHSSQRKDPGLNVAMYTNAKVDKLLEDASTTIDEQAQIKKYIQFESIVKADMPAVFLYSPDFIYVVSKNLKNFRVSSVVSPSDRYLNIYSWYSETQDIWKIFAPK
jgi:peptide/nickel transport system substrate-binding protein